MKTSVRTALALAACCSSPEVAIAQTYGDALLVGALHRHGGVQGIAIDATDRHGQPIHVARGRLDGNASLAGLPLNNALGDRIGTVSIRSRRTRGADREATQVVAELSRRLYTADTLREPDPFVAGSQVVPRAQALVDAALERHPSLVTVAMHVSLPGADNAIIASNFGRIGKAADKDDVHVIADGATLRETTDAGRRLAVELPLLDREGRTIGALSTSFMITGDSDRAYAEALTVRGELARALPSLAWLAAR